MLPRLTLLIAILIGLLSCNESNEKNRSVTNNAYPDVKIVGAMKNVMWKGELGGSILLDTISDKKGLYAVGPVSYLRGEIIIKDGQSYVSNVTSDSTMSVKKEFNVAAPFLVYTNVTDWNEIKLPTTITTINDLEVFIDQKTMDYKRPFAFKLSGQISSAIIHVQNLAKGSTVSSPKEAHAGQVKYPLNSEPCEIVGFFSTEHQGIFTHHDSYLHMHLITKDKSQMGHLDELEIEDMVLFLPKK